MRELLFLEPVLKTMIWGGNKLKTEFGYDIPSHNTGECWAISAHKNGDCTIKSGTYEGKHLSWLWENHKELFGNHSSDVFPLLIKIIDAKTDLSIQVHPDDAYAKVNENGSLGKTECWYILSCEEDATIVIGHNANTMEELKEMIENNQWNDLIKVRPIKKGDFFQINPGTVHAIKGGTVILETQQSSDVTYRLYDYGRLENGKPRELHIDKSIDVIKCPHVDYVVESSKESNENSDKQELISCPFYTVKHVQIHGEEEFEGMDQFINVSVIDGTGEIDSISVQKGDHFIIPASYGKYKFSGTLELIISHA